MIPLVDMPNGKHETTGEGNRIYLAAFTKKEKHKGQTLVFPGFICQGQFNEEETVVLRDYGWEQQSILTTTALWRNFNKESVKFTAQALDLRVFSPKQSLLFVVKQ